MNHGFKKKHFDYRYTLMVKCWQPLPLDRPSFKEIRVEIEQMLKNATSNFQVDNNSEEGDTNRQLKSNGHEMDEIEVYIPNQLIYDAVITAEYKL